MRRPQLAQPRPRLAEVLDVLGLLDDDTTPTIRVWIDRNAATLAPGFIEPVRQWLITLVDGDARTKPRTAASAYAYFGSVRPFLNQWATRAAQAGTDRASSSGFAAKPGGRPGGLGARPATSKRPSTSAGRQKPHARRAAGGAARG